MFQKDNAFSIRLAESIRIRNKYPDRIPVVIQPDFRISISKKKYLVSYDMTMGQFIYFIRSRIKLESHQSIVLLINDTVPSSSEIINIIYNRHKQKDGFLYINICLENIFG